MINSVIQGDCLEVMKDIPDNSIDLILTDPPYFRVKKDSWDRQWDKPEGFLNWLDSIAEQWQRILKPNGSLYCFASPKMAARVEVKLGDRFNIVNRITWQKPPFATKAEMFVKEDLRGFFPASESIIFCEHYGADSVAKGEAGYGAKCDELRGFVFEPLRAYLNGELEKAKINPALIREKFGYSSNLAHNWFAVSNSSGALACWILPLPEQYAKLQESFKGYFLREYEDLRREYEDLRRPFSVTADVPYTDVWTFPTVQAYKGKHPCEKPLAMIEHIITASSRENQVVLDCFGGSGTTAIAAMNTNRNYILIEKELDYFELCKERIAKHSPKDYSVIPDNPTLEKNGQLALF
jgi:site-specific DNA-methyltransferase (adenine-specific)